MTALLRLGVVMSVAATLGGCQSTPSPADCLEMAPDAHRLAASGQTDAFGNVVVLGTITSSELQPRAVPPTGTFELAVDAVLRGEARSEESVYFLLDDGLSLLVEEDHTYLVSGNREEDGRIRLVGCSGFSATRQIDNAEGAELKALADEVRPPD